jgi:hypothetical protein
MSNVNDAQTNVASGELIAQIHAYLPVQYCDIMTSKFKRCVQRYFALRAGVILSNRSSPLAGERWYP